MMNQLIKIICSISLLATLNACAIETKVTDPRTGQEYVVADRYEDVPGVKELAEMCAKEAGRKINRVVYADGYFDGYTKSCERACWLGIIESGLNYLEIQVEKPERYQTIKEPGIWKIYIGQLGDPNCNSDIQRYLSRHTFSRDMSNHCIAFKKNEEIESQYEGFNESSEIILSNEYHSKIYRGYGGYRDRITGEILGFQVYFQLTPRHRQEPMTLPCHTVGVKLNFNGLLKSEVLKPKGDIK